MNIMIRSEKIRDYQFIAEINELAFSSMIEDIDVSTFIPEKIMAAVLRHGEFFDPELSLVAELDGRIVGHAVYYPFQVLVGGDELKAVSLGPISVHPDFQNRGIGLKLMEEGHLRAKSKGYVFAFLLGHLTYYPRAGYRTEMLGKCKIKIPVSSIPVKDQRIEIRLTKSEHIKSLTVMWYDWFKDVDLAAFPGNSLLDWVSHNEGIVNYSVFHGEKIIGYLRYDKLNPANVRLFLAKDKQAAFQLLIFLHSRINKDTEQFIYLPLHPESEAVRKYISLPFEPVVKTMKAGMIKILDTDNQSISAYCTEVSAGTRKPGLLIWPPFFEEV